MTTENTPENLRLMRHARGGTLLLAMCLLAGCSSSDVVLSQDSRNVPFGDGSGSSSELVFSSLDVQRSEGFVPSDYTNLAFRSDSRLGVVEAPSVASQIAYPGDEASSLDRLRVIFLEPRPDRVTYFGRGRGERSQNRFRH